MRANDSGLKGVVVSGKIHEDRRAEVCNEGEVKWKVVVCAAEEQKVRDGQGLVYDLGVGRVRARFKCGGMCFLAVPA